MQCVDPVAWIRGRGPNGGVTGDRVPALGTGWSIRHVSELLGVPAPTLRSWERRYGIPATPRSAGGHRRYSEEALVQLRLMRDEIARGRQAADAVRTVRRLLGADGPVADHVAALLAGSRAMDPDAMREALDDAAATLGLPAAIDEVLMPGMRQIGAWWESGRCDVGQEHLTSEVARGWLSRETALATVPRHGRAVVLACGPRDLHTLGLEALALLLARDGHVCRVLGARTPARAAVTAVTATSAAAAVLVSHLATHRRPCIAALHDLAGTGCQVFYAGNAFAFPAAREGVPGTYLGESIAGAAGLIGAALAG